MKIKPFRIAGATLAAALTGTLIMTAQAAPFADADSIAYSQKLWSALSSANLVGPNAITSRPYKGTHPHGAVLDNMDAKVTVDGHTGVVIIKRNYGGNGVSVSAVADNPNKFLGAVTVMFKREAGYDSADKDWFWVKYKPDGSLHMNPKKMKLAGRVAKGMPKGCIACHKAAPGGDFVFSHNRY